MRPDLCLNLTSLDRSRRGGTGGSVATFLAQVRFLETRRNGLSLEWRIRNRKVQIGKLAEAEVRGLVYKTEEVKLKSSSH